MEEPDENIQPLQAGFAPLEIEQGDEEPQLDDNEEPQQPDQELQQLDPEPRPNVVQPQPDVQHQQPRNYVDRWKALTVVITVVSIIFIALYIVCATSTIDPPIIDETSDPLKVGQWKTVVPEDNGAARGYQLGMQSVHAILLPSGRVLMTPGSSFRNDKDGTTVYPDDVREVKESKMEGIFNESKDPFLNTNKTSYYKKVNNAGIYDPSTNEFFRVSHPVPEADPDNTDHFVPSDLFCTGHLQLPNGNALFVGGTQYYDPFFTGHKAAYIYDWIQDFEKDWAAFDWTKMPSDNTEKEPWSFIGFMDRGRWYPSIVPLMDGRFVIVGGFTDITNNPNERMYKFEVNDSVDIYDYRNSKFVNKNVSQLQNSPFKTRLKEDVLTEVANCTRCSDKATIDLIICMRECDEYKYDTFKLYPRMVLMPDGHRIFFTRDGDFNSMRDPKALHMRNTTYTYIMDIGTNDDPNIKFQRGPDLPAFTLNAGTVVRDPTDDKRILVSGGMKNSGGYYSPGLIEADDERCIVNGLNYDFKLANQFLGGRGSRGLLSYRMPTDETGIGSWEKVDENFLGTSARDERTMHYKLILPNRQLLVVGGGNYWFAQGVRNPVLYTPFKRGGYDRGQLVAPHLNERLYHNTALLLANGTILLAGGNANRASFDATEDIGIPRASRDGQPKFNRNSVDTNLFFVADGRIGRGHKPAPAEEWTAEIYYPPYLFIDKDRRTEIENLTLLSPSPTEPTFNFVETISNKNRNKNHYLFHSNLQVRIELKNLPKPEDCTIDSSLVLLKLGSSTHGWDTGQQLFEIPIQIHVQNEGSDAGSLEFVVPDSEEMQIIPAFYHLFYVDCRGKPTIAESVRFDNNVQNIRDKADAP